MSKNKWLILFALAAALCIILCTMAVVFLGIIGGFVSQRYNPIYFGPVYTFEQSPSTHSGYRHSTFSSGNTVYVNDYDEYALLSANTNPTQVVGRTEYGGDTICAIPGQKPTSYVIHVGWMGPEGIYRNSQLPPFDWRNATFQKMQFAIPDGPAANKQSTDAALIEDVVTTLKQAATTTPPSQVPGSYDNIYGLYLFSDQLPGLIYCVGVYMDNSGQVYVAENTSSKQWIQAGPRFTKWVQTH
jgi:hypothetical protein